MNEKNGDYIEGGNMDWSEKNEVDYWKFLKNIKKNKIRKVFIFSTIVIFCLLIVLKFPFIVAVITGICIALIGWGIETHGNDADSKPNVGTLGDVVYFFHFFLPILTFQSLITPRIHPSPRKAGLRRTGNGRLAHQRWRVEMWPWRRDFSREDSELTSLMGKKSSIRRRSLVLMVG